MNNGFSRRAFLAGLGAVAFQGPALANAPSVSLRPRLRGPDIAGRASQAGLQALIERSRLTGRVGLAVADVATGQPLEGLADGVGLPPASVAKSLTALYALDALGPDHRFRTRLLAGGALKDGILQGDLVLSGGGDPTLDTNALAQLAAQLKAAGLREVRGAFRVDDGILPYVRSIDPGQPDQLGYSPAVSGIALNFNRVHFEWRRSGAGYRVAMDARTDRYRPEVAMARMEVVNRAVPVYTYADRGGIDQWTVARQALGDDGSRWLPVRKPALYAGDVFATLARSHGIVLPEPEVGAGPQAGLREMGHVYSAPLHDLLADMLKYSNNLTAEMVGMSATVARGGRPKSLSDSATAMSDWAAAAYGMNTTRLVDHSGLGDASRMTASDLVRALVEVVRRHDGLRALLKPFPLRDAKRRVIKGHPIRVDAKTGTLNFVSGLGGYMTAADGTELAFAIFIADMDRRARIPPEDREVPEGARAWNVRAKTLQQALIERWGDLYGAS
jgi:D-alanyl-D-alanine carboxypeptidase/D-alanyl-D-alanine-endopeptidase (penicillin-binding protein 4)